ncbi:uncharacterized protein LOC113771253 [Coffea eugenioides]|uniref:uncharacterized protein LOC113771253 n=1 Tax=Coffea eugenioides TaxID=49369 RepID=UPI000F609873|nr:uncharacterized protein LOC113771253 [Coffea eugenioides]
MPPIKTGSETGRVRMLEPPRVAPARRGQSGPGQSKNTSQGGQGVTFHASCRYCGKLGHVENNCWRKGKRYLRGRNAEHQISSCPLMSSEGSNTQRSDKLAIKPTSSREGRPKVPARLYAFDHQQIPDSTEVIEGTIPVLHRLVKVLIDHGATHSFMKPDFMSGIDVKSAKLPYDLEVRTPTGNQYLTSNLVYRNCEIWVGECKLLANLISLLIKGYDVILGMDWIVQYHARLDCKMKVVKLCILGEAILRLDVRGKLASSTLISEI